MQTRTSLYKLYTKSKALYISIHQASVPLTQKSCILCVCALRCSARRHHPSSFKTSNTSIHAACQHLKTTFLTTQLDRIPFFYINTKLKCTYIHINTNITHAQTHAHIIYNRTHIHTYIHTQRTRTWHSDTKRPRVHFFFKSMSSVFG